MEKLLKKIWTKSCWSIYKVVFIGNPNKDLDWNWKANEYYFCVKLFRCKEVWKINLFWLQHIKGSTTILLLPRSRQQQLRIQAVFRAWPVQCHVHWHLRTRLLHRQHLPLTSQNPSPTASRTTLLQPRPPRTLSRNSICQKSHRFWLNKWLLPWPKIPISELHWLPPFLEECHIRMTYGIHKAANFDRIILKSCDHFVVNTDKEELRHVPQFDPWCGEKKELIKITSAFCSSALLLRGKKKRVNI